MISDAGARDIVQITPTTILSSRGARAAAATAAAVSVCPDIEHQRPANRATPWSAVEPRAVWPASAAVEQAMTPSAMATADCRGA
jgi:hypothetical protein